MHCTNGTIGNLAANEQECFEQMRIVLSYLPNLGDFYLLSLCQRILPIDFAKNFGLSYLGGKLERMTQERLLQVLLTLEVGLKLALYGVPHLSLVSLALLEDLLALSQ
jgi:hypothetical protein